MKLKSESEVAQSCLTLIDPMDCSLPGSSIHGIFQARVPEWVAIAFSKWVAETSKNMLILPGHTELDASIRSINVFPPFPLFSPFSLYVKKNTHCMCVIQYRHVSCCMTLPWALHGTSLGKKKNQLRDAYWLPEIFTHHFMSSISLPSNLKFTRAFTSLLSHPLNWGWGWDFHLERRKLSHKNLSWLAIWLFPQFLGIIGRRQWHPTPVLLPGNSHGQRSLVGCSPWGR